MPAAPAPIPMASIRLMDKPGFMDSVVAEVANGGSLLDLATRIGVPYEHATRWIHTDPVRHSVYEGALVSRAEWFQQRILRELRDLCFVDIKDAYGPDGCLLAVDKMPENVRRNIAGIETVETFDKDGVKTGEIKKVKLWDKGQSVERAMKHLRLLGVEEKRLVVSGEVRHTVEGFDLEERIKSLRDRKPMPVIEAVTVPNNPGDDI